MPLCGLEGETGVSVCWWFVRGTLNGIFGREESLVVVVETNTGLVLSEELKLYVSHCSNIPASLVFHAVIMNSL